MKKQKRAKPAKVVEAPSLPELTDWQSRSLEIVGNSALSKELVFGGGAALASVYLHHRFSEDLDFFLTREPAEGELLSIAKALRTRGTTIDQRVLGPAHSLVLKADSEEFGKIDFAVSPYARAARPVRWRGFRVESLEDMTINKVQTVLTRFQARDFVDLYFLLREGPEKDLDRLLELVRRKFGLGADHMTLAERLVSVREIRELPRMIRPVDLETLREFFWERARDLVRKG